MATLEMEALRIPGLAIAFVEDGRVTYKRGLGLANIEAGTPLTPDMLFRVGSMTKTITALAVVSEAKARRIPLDAPIGRYMKGLAPNIARVTLTQLLAHTAGFRDLIVATPIDQDSSQADLAREVRSWDDSIFFTDPGDVHSYSNLGFVLAGAFLEDISGKRYADVVAERVLNPLGIADATFDPVVATRHAFAEGYDGGRGQAPQVVRPIRTDTRHWPAGFLWASALDYSRVAIALMNRGMIDGRQALEPDVVDLVEQPRVAMPGDPQVMNGFGLVVRDIGALRELSKSGRMDGYGSDFWMALRLNRAVIMMRNRLDTAPRQTIAALTKLLGLPDEPAPPADAAGAPVGDMAGRYLNGDHAIVIAAGAAGLTMVDEDRTGTLTPVGRSRFTFAFTNSRTHASGTAVVFAVLDPAGRVKYVATGERAFRRR